MGRSVWNSRWLLIIPGRTLFRDPAEGIARFVHGRVVDEATGARDGRGVRDIRLEFEVYAYSGQ